MITSLILAGAKHQITKGEPDQNDQHHARHFPEKPAQFWAPLASSSISHLLPYSNLAEMKKEGLTPQRLQWENTSRAA
jgi:hypothetical protein